MPAETVLVVGATGVLGGEIVRQLRSADCPVRALVRASSDASKLAALRTLGVQTIVGNIHDRASIQVACNDVGRVVTTATAIASSDPSDSILLTDHLGALNLVDIADQSRVEQFVYISFPKLGVDSPLQQAKRAVEFQLERSNMGFSVLQATNFMESWLQPKAGYNWLTQQVTLIGEGTNPVNWISVNDVARYAVSCLRSPRVERQVTQLGGPEALSPLQVVDMIEGIIKMRLDIVHVRPTVIKEQMEGASNAIQASKLAIALATSLGLVVDIQPALDAFSIRLHTVYDYLCLALTGHNNQA